MVLGAALTLLGVGVYRSARMPVDVFPDLTAPRVTVVTESTGLASEEVESLVTYPIEAGMSGIAGVRRVRSASAQGISLVWVEFEWGVDPAAARQQVTERLQGVVGTLPSEARPPVLAPAASVMGEIAFVALTSTTKSALELRRAAEQHVRRQLLAVEGVSQVVAIGGEVKQYQILVKPQVLEGLGVTLSEIIRAVENGSENAPGGYAIASGQESVIRVLGRAQGLADLEDILVTVRDGVPIRIRDLAKVQIGSAVMRGAASYNARPAVLLSIIKQPEADTAGTTRHVDQALDTLVPQLSARGMTLERDVFRQKDFIDTAVDNLVSVLRDGALLVILVLWLFLWSLKPTLISAVAVPLSLVSAVLVLDLLGLAIDTMTLGGLAIAIGELVDDAIVDVENVTRRLRERAALPASERGTIVETVRVASLEIRSSVVSATFILMLVFTPLLLLDGLEGRLLFPLAVSYLVAIFASLVVAVTVTPVLCSFLLRPKPVEGASADPPLIRGILRLYRPVLHFSLRRPLTILAFALLVLGTGLYGLSRMGRAFLPEFNEGSLTINMVLKPGTALAESNALAAMAERKLLEDDAVLSVGRRTGRAERDEHVLGVETSELEVRIAPGDPRGREVLFSDMRERLRSVPGAHFTLGQPISHRIEHMVSGQRTSLSIKVFGPNLRDNRRVAHEIKSLASARDGIVDLSVEPMVDIPQLVVRLKGQAAGTYGFSAGEAAKAIGTALWGTRAKDIYEEGMSTEVVVKYPVRDREDVQTVRRTRIPTPSGAFVPIAAIADVERAAGPNFILRENVERRVVVTANVSGPNKEGTYASLKEAVAQLKKPDDVRVVFAGQFEREESTSRKLLWLGLLVVLGIGLIVGTTLGSARRALIVLTNLPLALAGGALGVFLAGKVLSVATTIGFITLFGIATRNGILVATRVRDLELSGESRRHAVERAAEERLAPILMTAVTAALGLLPLALALGQPGSEIQAPMALVILTGLTTSTALNMVVVPALLHRFGGNEEGGEKPPAGAAVGPPQPKTTD